MIVGWVRAIEKWFIWGHEEMGWTNQMSHEQKRQSQVKWIPMDVVTLLDNS